MESLIKTVLRSKKSSLPRGWVILIAAVGSWVICAGLGVLLFQILTRA